VLELELDGDAALDDLLPLRPAALKRNSRRLCERLRENGRVLRLFGERDCGTRMRLGDYEPSRPPAHASPGQLDHRLQGDFAFRFGERLRE
jgi:hypothetical protein